MRDQGRLVEWFDEKGYGFIQPNDSSKDRVFLHIKDFAKPGPRPIPGCALEYIVQLDGQGRFKAKQVTYLKATQAKKVKTKPRHSPVTQQKMQPMQVAIIAYILTLATLVLLGLLSMMVVLVILLMNLITYGLYAHDKAAAQQGSQRVPENTLHVVSLLGGWPSAWLAQQRLRHKTQKQPFRKIYFCTIAFNILIILWIISPFNGLKL
ncbi:MULTISPECIES: DUF1294 domain-containing protein [unclassified Acinetobacter]|uniref:DUF1294 domain-containing protein n=1 Tax=unclassified Acinetobacter TaxID=196816 RepID=UPI000447A004|nr:MULTISPECIES: DUF1294 domain-containing protein [unclassified Acinetobacter]EZQ07143.1 cold-shock protein [Acinetobacter sp. Ver3]SEL52292.1 Uncharacterized membrane protein YsdA, DUF1294 family [Acinetobacter sp. DSM 11652]